MVGFSKKWDEGNDVIAPREVILPSYATGDLPDDAQDGTIAHDTTENQIVVNLNGTWTNITESFGMDYSGKNISVGGESLNPMGVFFKPDGLKMYIFGIVSPGNEVYQYTLSSAWDVSTATYDSVCFDLDNEFSGSQGGSGIHFKTDGAKMYITERSADLVYQYSLGTPWDLSTTSYDSVSFSTVNEAPQIQDLHFKPDGTKMYVTGWSSDKVFQYELSTPWVVSSASYSGTNYDLSGLIGNPLGLIFDVDGVDMYISTNGYIYKFTMSTPFDVSTSSYTGLRLYTAAEDNIGNGIYMKEDKTIIYMVGILSRKVYQYD